MCQKYHSPVLLLVHSRHPRTAYGFWIPVAWSAYYYDDDCRVACYHPSFQTHRFQTHLRLSFFLPCCLLILGNLRDVNRSAPHAQHVVLFLPLPTLQLGHRRGRSFIDMDMVTPPLAHQIISFQDKPQYVSVAIQLLLVLHRISKSRRIFSRKQNVFPSKEHLCPQRVEQ